MVTSACATLREQLNEACTLLAGTIAEVTQEQAHWQPPGTANPIGANYAHAVLSVDMSFHELLQGTATLAESGWAGRMGLSELPPGGGAPERWGQWAGRVRVDLSRIKTFAEAVFAAADSYLAALDDEELSRPINLTAMGFGSRSRAWIVGTTIMNVNLHCGEISCLKGLQGLRGYPV